MTACPPDQRRPLRRVSDEEVSLAQHVDHDTAVDDRPSWRAADPGAALERPATQKRYSVTQNTGNNTFENHLRTIFILSVYSDVDECASNNGGCNENAVCVNTVGSYFCYCKLGYAGRAQHFCHGKSSAVMWEWEIRYRSKNWKKAIYL